MGIHRPALILTILVSVLPAHADITDEEFAKCVVIGGSLERLECFDQLAIARNLSAPQEQPAVIEGNGNWRVSVSNNPMDGLTTVSLVLEAAPEETRGHNAVSLNARCLSDKTDVYIKWNDYLSSEASVVTRVGQEKAETSRWGMSTDGKTTFHSRPIGFLKKLMQSNQLVAQVPLRNDISATAAFDTSGLANALKSLRETCSW